ncbi:Protein 21.1 [Giardia lamblia P15]|uniref:Protein 21.1 n=1 Tax=Giardia intestinalis (strain P15) TaxID=658858 RepID=E1EX32_GIAIA|nr:Protein 21.1 [Giardia lamblia P15]
MISTPESTLIRAVKRSDKRLLEVILPKNTQFGSRDATGKTALMIAAEMNNRYFCQLLVDREHYFLTTDGKNALILAVEAGANYVIPTLAQRCSYIQDSFGLCALSHAAQIGDLSICKLLAEHCHLRDVDYERALKFLRKECRRPEEKRQIEEFLLQGSKNNKKKGGSFDSVVPSSIGMRSISSGGSKTSSHMSYNSVPPTIILQKLKDSHDICNTEQDTGSLLNKGIARASSIGTFSGSRLSVDSSKTLDQVMEKIEIERLQTENTRLKNAISSLTVEKRKEKESMEKQIKEYSQKLHDAESVAIVTQLVSASGTPPNPRELEGLEKELEEHKHIIQKKDQEIAILRRLVETNWFMKDLDEKLLLLGSKSNKTDEKADTSVSSTLQSNRSSCVSMATLDKSKLSVTPSAGQIDSSIRMSDLKELATPEAAIEPSHADSHSSQRPGSQLTQPNLIPLLNEYKTQLKYTTDLLTYYQNIFKQQLEPDYYLSSGITSSLPTNDHDRVINNLRNLLSLRTAGMDRAISLVQEKDLAFQSLLSEHADSVRRNMRLQAALWKHKRTLLHIDIKDLLEKYNISGGELELSRFKALIEEMHGEIRLLSTSLLNERKELKAFEAASDRYLQLYYNEQQKSIKLENDILLLRRDVHMAQIELEKLSSRCPDHKVGTINGTDSRELVYPDKEQQSPNSVANNQNDNHAGDLTTSLEGITEMSMGDVCEGCIELNKELSQLKTELKRIKNINEGLTHKNGLLVKDLETIVHELDPVLNVRRIYAKGKLSASGSSEDTPQEMEVIRKKIRSLTLENPPLSVRMEQPITSKLLREPTDGDTVHAKRHVTDMWTQTFNLSVPIEDELSYNVPLISPTYKLLPNITQEATPMLADIDNLISSTSPPSQSTTILYLNTTTTDQPLQCVDATILHNPLQSSSVFHATSAEALKDLDICSEERLDEKLGLSKKPKSPSSTLTQKLSNLLKEAIDVPPPPLPSGQHSTRARSRRIINSKDTKDMRDNKGNKQQKVKDGREGKHDVLQLTPLMVAVQQKDLAAVSSNLQYGKVATSTGMTALMFAVEKNFLEAVKVLAPLEAGIYAPNNETALTMALRAGYIDAAEILTPYEGVKLSRVNLANDRFTELMKAAKNNNINMVWALLGYQKRLQDDSKRTALMYAADAGNFDICRILAAFEAGMSTITGDTALMIAVINQHIDIAQLLLPLETGHHGNRLTNVGKGYTALHLSIYYGHYDLVKLLYPKEHHILDADGRSYLHYAKNCSSRVSRETKDAISAYFLTEASKVSGAS